MTDRDRLRAQIEDAAHAAGISPDLLDAVVSIESSGDAFAWNPEPRYPYLWDVRGRKPFRLLTLAEGISELPPSDFSYLAGDRDQEWWAQQASWGLCQIMGAVARAQGFAGPFLPGICDPATNLALGAGILRGLILWAHGDLAQASAGYNGGRGGWRGQQAQDYGAKVLRRLAAIERARETRL